MKKLIIILTLVAFPLTGSTQEASTSAIEGNCTNDSTQATYQWGELNPQEHFGVFAQINTPDKLFRMRAVGWNGETAPSNHLHNSILSLEIFEISVGFEENITIIANIPLNDFIRGVPLNVLFYSSKNSLWMSCNIKRNLQ